MATCELRMSAPIVAAAERMSDGFLTSSAEHAISTIGKRSCSSRKRDSAASVTTNPSGTGCPSRMSRARLWALPPTSRTSPAPASGTTIGLSVATRVRR